MPDRLITRREAKVRRVVVKRHVEAQGYPPDFVEQMYLRLAHHDRLHRARAVVQALMGYRPAPRFCRIGPEPTRPTRVTS